LGFFDANAQTWDYEVWSATSVRRREWPAWFFSMALHTIVMVAIGLLGGSQANPAGQAVDRTTGIALVQRTEDTPHYFSENSADSATSSPTPSETPAAFPTMNQLPTRLATRLPSFDTMLADKGRGPSLAGAESLIRGGPASRNTGGGGITTQVFGAQGTGSKFVYVIDRSASMEGFDRRPMKAAKAELIASLQDLQSVHQFQIIFYSSELRVFNPLAPQPPKMMFGTESNKRMAVDYVRGIVPDGSTRHREALEMALALRPDVIFFLTDADEPQLRPAELADLHRRNRGPTAIHTIEFGIGPAFDEDNFLARLAHENGGNHVYVDVSRLKLN
jgi:hypothetical protein